MALRNALGALALDSTLDTVRQLVADIRTSMLAPPNKTYAFVVPAQLNLANKVYFDVFNAADSGVQMRLTKLFAIPALEIDNGGANTPPIRADVFRTLTIGTGGTVFSRQSTPDKALASFWRFNMTDPLPPAGITGRMLPTGGGTDATYLWPAYVTTRFQDSAAFQMQFLNLVLEADAPMMLPPGAGLRVVQSATVSGNSQLGWLGAFEVV